MIRFLPFLGIFLPLLGMATDFTVSSGTDTVDCDTYGGGIGPGDTITLDAGTRGDLLIRDCEGTASQPIIVRNSSSGQTVISNSNPSNQFVWEFRNNKYFHIDGFNYDWSGKPEGDCGYVPGPTPTFGRTQCGLVCEGGTNACMKFYSRQEYIEIRGVECDGLWPTIDGYCFAMNDQTYDEDDCPGCYRESWIIENNYTHDTGGTCWYLGPNVKDPQVIGPRNMKIRNNLLERCGCDGIKVKSNLSTATGRTEVYNNWVDETGVKSSSASSGCTGNGIMSYESTGVDIFGNYVRHANGPSAGSCISFLTQKLTTSVISTLEGTAYNNILQDCENNGITVNRVNTNTPTYDDVFLYNNTVADAGNSNLRTNVNVTSGVTAQDNISCPSGEISMSGSHTVSSNTEAACGSIGFVNYVGDDLHLTSGSAAVSAGGVYANPPDVDFDQCTRPQGGTTDDGALEFIETAGACSGGGDPGDPLTGVTAPKPDPHSIDNLEALYPDWLWVINEGTGTTVEDDGSGTDIDLTITGADWSSDSIGNYLAFVSANSDVAKNSSVVTPTGTQTMCAIVRISNPTTLEVYVSVGDASDADKTVHFKSLDGGTVQINAADGTGSAQNPTQPIIDDGLWHMVCWRFDNSNLDVSIDGSAFDTQDPGLTSLLTGLDTVCLGARCRSTDDRYADVDILAAWWYDSSLSDANVSTLFNSGDPWPPLGVDPSSGDPPGPDVVVDPDYGNVAQ